MADAEPSLTGRRVLLTRPAGRGESLARRLRQLGADVEMRPTIALEPPGAADAARRAVRQLQDYDWVVFTSAAGVRFFLALHRELCGSGAEIPPSIGSIGLATARELEQHGHPSAVVAEESRSEGLARALVGHITADQRVLVVRPEVARPTLVRALEALGARPDAVCFYRNIPAPGLHAVVRDVCDGRFDVVLFSSPSTLERLLQTNVAPRSEVLAALERSRPVAIGPVTASAIELAGMKPAGIAAEPADDSIVECIESLFR